MLFVDLMIKSGQIILRI